MMPGWNDLDSVKRLASDIDVITIAGWSFTLVFEGLARFWKRFSHVFDVLALVTFALAISGEWVGHRYAQREDFLYGQRQQQESRALQAQLSTEDSKFAEAEGEASEAKSQLKALERSEAGRVLTIRQRSILISQLKTISPQQLFLYGAPDPESQTYLQQLTDLFRSAGWEIKPPTIQLGFHIATYPTGLEILVKDVKAAPLGAATLQAALKKAGIDAPGVRAFPFILAEGECGLFVGSKARAKIPDNSK